MFSRLGMKMSGVVSFDSVLYCGSVWTTDHLGDLVPEMVFNSCD